MAAKLRILFAAAVLALATCVSLASAQPPEDRPSEAEGAPPSIFRVGLAFSPALVRSVPRVRSRSMNAIVVFCYFSRATITVISSACSALPAHSSAAVINDSATLLGGDACTRTAASCSRRIPNSSP